MKDSYKCYEKVLIVIVTAIVLCFSVHVRASGVGNKESAQEIVNEYSPSIANAWSIGPLPFPRSSMAASAPEI